ncbi:MAG: hypothetical protein ACP5NZ_02270 [Nanobdellota archaeon]
MKREYIALILGIALLFMGVLFWLSPTSNPFAVFSDENALMNSGQTSAVQTPAPTCNDGIQNQGERHADCGGPCEACPPDCSDGIQNQDEEKVDCGGTICSACPTCSDGIQNQGERHADCGGPCEACPPDCTDGILNQDEEKIDCGGKICAPCPTCFDKIQNQGEGGVDCGGPCSTPCPPTCSDRIQNQGETGVDCGGPCPACPPAIITSLTPDEVAKVKSSLLASEFISDLPKDGIISIHFFNYQNGGQRVELDTFLFGKDQLLTSGSPDISVIIHSKYIAELTSTNLCEIIPKARTAGDLAFETYESDTKLLMKYSGMMKYKTCLGF